MRIKGDVPALGDLTITELQGANQDFVIAALQSRYYDAAATAALFYEAEGRTALGGAATAVGTSPASGGGSNVMRQGTLTPTYQAMLSTRATGGGAHLTHVGDYHVWARVFRPTTNTGAVSLRLDWAVGDFRRYTSNTPVDFDANEIEGQWLLVDLGLVHLPKVQQGAQKWEGRIVASSDVTGDDLDVDWFAVVPTERYAELHAVLQLESPTSFSARDEFDQSAGALNGKTAPVGGAWATSGGATDLSVNATDHNITRSASDSGEPGTPGGGRFAISGVGGFAAQVVQADIFPPSGSGHGSYQGVVARYVDGNNWLMAGFLETTGFVQTFRVRKEVAGTTTTLADIPIALPAGTLRVRLMVDAGGRWYAWYGVDQLFSGTPIASGQDGDLATGGTLASGKPGIYDAGGLGGFTRTFDNFLAFVPTTDAAIFASQSLKWRHDGSIREDSGGTIWQPVSSGVVGDHLFVPASGREGRSTRFFVKACRGPVYRDGSAGSPKVIGDPNIDDIRGQLTYIPRGLMVVKP